MNAFQIDSIQHRDRLLRDLREFFHGRGFCEVHPPCLASDCVVDTYLDPIQVAPSQTGVSQPETEASAWYYLQTSPESAMKRMLCEGSPSIFAITPVFRRGELGVRHNTEFIMLEWYELDANHEDGVATLGQLACKTFGVEGYGTARYQELFETYCGIDPLKCELKALCEKVQAIDASLATSIREDRDALLDVLLSEEIEPQLGQDKPLIVTHYPASQAALARIDESDRRWALRFELFFRGIELANGYDELRDADELVRRFEQTNAARVRNGRNPLPVNTQLVKAMRQGMPPCSGVALGVDRLLMVKHDYTSIGQVIPFTIDRV